MRSSVEISLFAKIVIKAYAIPFFGYRPAEANRDSTKYAAFLHFIFQKNNLTFEICHFKAQCHLTLSKERGFRENFVEKVESALNAPFG